MPKKRLFGVLRWCHDNHDEDEDEDEDDDDDDDDDDDNDDDFQSYPNDLMRVTEHTQLLP